MSLPEFDPTVLERLSPAEKRVALSLLEEKEKRARRRKITTYYPETGPLRRELYTKQMAFFEAGAKYRERCILAANRIGKMQPYSAIVQTPTGERKMGDLVVGDKVLGEDGKSYNVLAVFDHGVQPVFRVSFDDESSTECGMDHLWSFIHPKDRFEYKNSHGKSIRVKTFRNRTVASLSEIIRIGGVSPKPLRRIAVPVTEPVEYESSNKLVVSPYIMGALLGDGCFQKECVKFSNVDSEILDRVKLELPDEMDLVYYGGCDYGVSRPGSGGDGFENPVQKVLKDTGLYNHHSYNKFIPDEYKYRSSRDRFELLRGLMDTDGSIYGASQMEYSTSSLQLAEDVKWLVQSLGGKAKIRARGTKRGVAFRVLIEIQSGNPFYLSRKANRYSIVKYSPDRLLTKIEYVRDEESRCILVDSPLHTYLTDEFIITHNTEGCTLYEASLHMTGNYPKWWVGRRFKKPVRCWFAGTNAETTRDILQKKLLGPLDDIGTGLIPFDNIAADPRRDSGIPDAVETFTVKHVSGGVSRGQFKSFAAGRKSFEGDEQDIIVLDEECPMDVYSECLIRTMTTNGMVLLGFTPKEGLTETVLAFMPGGVMPEGGVSGKRFIIGATWDDAPHLSEEAKQDILSGTPIHLRDAVSKGLPQIGSGAIYPLMESDITCAPFEIPEWWPVAYAMDVGWNATAAVWGAWDRDLDIWYIFHEYKRGQAEPASHVMAIQAPGKWIPGVIDPASAGTNQKDGTKLMQEYEDLGLELYKANNAVEAGLFECYKRYTTGRLKIFKTCVKTLEEIRIYRRDKHGKVAANQEDHLMDCKRYLINTGKDIARVYVKGSMRKMSVSDILDIAMG